MEIYDAIAENYKNQNLSSFKRKVTVDYTFLQYVGDVRGQNVVDFACGEGYFCRPIKQSGAASVVGIDISSKMIALAKSEEEARPLGISYECLDVVNLPEIGKFDIALAAFLLHYSKTKDELFKMCRNIFVHLKEGGRLIGLNSSPTSPLQLERKYDSTRTCDGPVKEGCVIKISLYENNEFICGFDNYHWEKKTYEDALTAAGFKDIKWHAIMVSQEGIDKFGAEFWEDYLRQPGVVVFECRKNH